VAAMFALNRTSDRERPPLQLWYTDTMTDGILSRFVRPDSIVAITTDAGSAVLALDTDEGTEHQRSIRSKLAAYRRPLSARPAWHLVVVVPGEFRAAWMLRSIWALGHGSSPVPISPTARLTPCSGHSPQDTPPVRSGRCSRRRGGCCPRPSAPVPGLNCSPPAAVRRRTAPSRREDRPSRATV
jgi:hypothetical protein